MTLMELPDWDDLAHDPGKYVESLTEQVKEAQTFLYRAKLLLRKAERQAGERAEYLGWKDDGMPEGPQRPPRPRPEADVLRPLEDGEEAPPKLTHKKMVLQLLGQDPTRSWKVRHVQDALGLENEKSLRVTMDGLVATGQLSKDADSNYRRVL